MACWLASFWYAQPCPSLFVETKSVRSSGSDAASILSILHVLLIHCIYLWCRGPCQVPQHIFFYFLFTLFAVWNINLSQFHAYGVEKSPFSKIRIFFFVFQKNKIIRINDFFITPLILKPTLLCLKTDG